MADTTEITKALEKLLEHYESDPAYTLIAGGTSSSSWIGKGTITLKQPLTNFDDFLVIWADDGGSTISFQEHQVWLWNHFINIEKNMNGQNSSMGKCFGLFRGDTHHWHVDPSKCSSTSLVISPTSTTENSLIFMIYGIKKKAKAAGEADGDVKKSLNALWERSNITPKITLLFGGTKQNSGAGTGTITLSEPLTNFDDFVVHWGWDSRVGDYYTRYNVKAWNKMKSIGKAYNNIETHIIYCGDLFWNVKPNTTTNSSFVTSSENSWIFSIWGINYDR